MRLKTFSFILLAGTSLSPARAQEAPPPPAPAAAAEAEAPEAEAPAADAAAPPRPGGAGDHRHRPAAARRGRRQCRARDPAQRGADPRLWRVEHRRAGRGAGAADAQRPRPPVRPADRPPERPAHRRLRRDPRAAARGDRARRHPARGGGAELRLSRRPARREHHPQGEFPLGHRPGRLWLRDRGRPDPPRRSTARSSGSAARAAGTSTPAISARMRCSKASAT